MVIAMELVVDITDNGIWSKQVEFDYIMITRI